MACTAPKPSLTLPPPSPVAGLPQRVVIKHPDYPHKNTLLELEAVDHDAVGRRGLLRAYVQLVCDIVTGHRFRSYLAADGASTSTSHPSPALTDLLPAGVYFLHPVREHVIAHTPDLVPYPIVPNFRDWSFPHCSATQPLPLGWQEARQEPVTHNWTSAQARDGTCRMTGSSLSNHLAHIIPRQEESWFRDNEMSRYRLYTPSGSDILEAVENRLLLRMDVHCSWDLGELSFVPKYDSIQRTWHWTAHANRSVPAELCDVYHNVKMQPIRGIPPQFFLARLAYDIFPLLRDFLNSSERRRLLVRTQGGTQDWYEADDCAHFTHGQGQSRSRSPPKRQGDKTSQSPSKKQRWSAPDPQQQQAHNYSGRDGDKHASDSAIGGFHSSLSRKRRRRDELNNSEGDTSWSSSEIDADEHEVDGDNVHEQGQGNVDEVSQWLCNQQASAQDVEGDGSREALWMEENLDDRPRGRKRTRGA